MVWKSKRLRVANLKGHWKASAYSAAFGLGDYGCAGVNAGDMTAEPNSVGNAEGIGAGTATDVQDLSASLKAETVKDRGLPGNHSR